MDRITDTTILATMIPLSIFTKKIHKSFEKHSMLESTLEIIQHFYIQMTTEPDEYSIFPRDIALYTLRCNRCGKYVYPQFSIGEILMHAPLAMSHHWDIIQPNEDMKNVNEMNSMPLLFTSYESYIQ